MIMKIRDCVRIISKGKHIQTPAEEVILYFLDEYTYCNNKPIAKGFLREYLALNGETYLELVDPYAVYKLNTIDNLLSKCISIPDGCIRLGYSKEWFVYWNYEDKKNVYTCVRNGVSVWTITCEYDKLFQIQDFALLWDALGSKKGSCQLIELSSGTVIWELDHPGTHVSQVYPYEDKVIIVWFAPLGQESKDRVLCVEIPSGKILWENDAARNYQKYGDDKLIYFQSSLWKTGYEHGENHQLAELDVRTGAFQMYKFPGYNSRVYSRTMVYKDFLFYGSLNHDFYVGAIDLRTHEMLPEVKVDFTPGDFNQIASIGVYNGQLYVEVQTELDHSDIHVFDLDEGE